jgi:hypothetical protein
MTNKSVAEMPASIRVGAVTFRVTIDPDDWMRYEHKNQRKGDYGHTQNLEATIYVNPASTPDVARLTLWHEVMHAMCETVMGSPDWHGLGKQNDAREEAVIRRLESPIVLVLRDNPALVEYLLG